MYLLMKIANFIDNFLYYSFMALANTANGPFLS